jgi:Mn-dependent DtxR family transcriptional regulator
LKVNRYQQDLLNGLAELEALGIEEPTRRQLGFVTAKSAKSSHFSNMISALRTAGIVDYPHDGNIALTPVGRSLARSDGRPNSLADLHERVRRLLNGYQVRIFDAVVAIYPHDISREELAEKIEASPDSSHFANMISALRTAEVITYSRQGHVRAEETLFPEGLL